MKLTLSINLDNAAFEGEDCGHEIARTLVELSRRLDGVASWDLPDKGGVWDSNGNKVGVWVVSEG